MGGAESRAIARLLAEAPVIKELPSDPEWEKQENRMAAHAFQNRVLFDE